MGWPQTNPFPALGRRGWWQEEGSLSETFPVPPGLTQLCLRVPGLSRFMGVLWAPRPLLSAPHSQGSSRNPPHLGSEGAGGRPAGQTQPAHPSQVGAQLSSPGATPSPDSRVVALGTDRWQEELGAPGLAPGMEEAPLGDLSPGSELRISMRAGGEAPQFPRLKMWPQKIKRASKGRLARTAPYNYY